jgi:hypothetical protein
MTLSELELIKHCLLRLSLVEVSEAVFKSIDIIDRQIHLKKMDPRKND